MELRPYQREAVDAIYAYFQEKDGNPLVVMPTGTGKSVVIAGFLRESLYTWNDTRVIVLTHVRELIQQNFNALLRAWPDAPAGIYSAGLNRREMDSQIVFAGIQSIYKRAYEVQRCDLVLIDECHLLAKSESGMYRQFLKTLKVINPDLKVIGFTATPFRMDQGMLYEGDDAIFTDLAYDVPILRMIKEGYLVPLVPKQTKMTLDVSGVHVRGGEFIAKELEDAVNKAEITTGAVDEIVTGGRDCGSWLIFCSGVDHAKNVCQEIRSRDITCEVIHGELPLPERDRILRDFKDGRVRCITNMNVLTTGFDAPGVDMIGMLRPTKSQSLYVQMLGRGTRLSEGKEDCLVLDFAGNTKRHGPVDEIHKRVKRPGEGDGGEAPVKTCPSCQTICSAAALTCPTCNFQFPPREIDLDRKASTAPLLSTQIKAEWITVTNVSYSLHERPGKIPSMMVTYMAGLIRHREWVCFEHTGYPHDKAVTWWMQRSNLPVPSKTTFALRESGGLRRPASIRVKQNGQYTDIVGYQWT
jgi:DNA repair protein RadD